MTDLPLLSPRAYARAATMTGVYMLVPVLLFGCLVLIELLQMRTSTGSAIAVVGGLLGLASALYIASVRRQRENLKFIEQLPPDEQARWRRIVIVHGRSRRATVLTVPVLCLLGMLGYGVLNWPWTPPSLGQIVGLVLTSTLASGTLTWSLMWLLAGWSAWSEATR